MTATPLVQPLQIEYVPIDSVHPDPKNRRRHGARNREANRGSLIMFGQVEAFLVQRSTGRILHGNDRWQHLKDLGATHVNVVRLDLDDDRADALSLAMNRPAEMGEWDPGVVDVVAHLEAAGIDLGHLWKPDELDALLATFDSGEKLQPLEEVPLPGPMRASEAVTRLGDLWTFEGGHRLLCGDARSPDDVARLVDGRAINLVVTSPPYAEQREYDPESGFVPVPPDAYVEWYAAVAANIADHLAPDGSYFLNIRAHCEDGQRVLYVFDLVLAHVRAWGWRFVEDYVWIHGGTPKEPVNRFKNGYEPIFQFTRQPTFKFRPDRVRHDYVFRPTALMDSPEGGAGLHPSQQNGTALQGKSPTATQGMGGRGAPVRSRKSSRTVAKLQGAPGAGSEISEAVESKGELLAYPSNVLSLGKNKEALGHGAAFPVNLPHFYVQAYSDPGDAVYDPFAGSGTTLVAAHKDGRVGLGMELSPAYCDLIVRRLVELGLPPPTNQRGEVFPA